MSLPPATDFRPLGLRLLNAAFPRAWAAGVLPYPDLLETTLDAMAMKSTGLADFGDDSFARSQLRVLLPALENEARLNPMGRVIAHGGLLKALKERLWAEALFKAHPEILDRPLAPPIIVMGQMRSGTTRLQRLLGQDRRFAALRLYESMSPVPWPSSRRSAERHPGRPHHRDPRIAYTRRAFAFLSYINPGIAATHPTGALEIDEELGLLDASFTGAQIEAQRRVPSFARYCEATDQAPAYAHLRRLLQLASWFRGS
ncbi:MAG: sulfotransferase, partial [Polymorphobacter sp.]